MLIIFDLDDTLVQTTASLTPHLLANAVRVMVTAGLAVGDLEEAIDRLLRLDLHFSIASETLDHFLESYPDGRAYRSLGMRQIYDAELGTFPIDAMPHANEVLETLGKKHLLTIVTAGIELRQLEKIEKAGIEQGLFSKIIVCTTSEKKFYYNDLAEAYEYTPSHVLVCGDRIERDLVPAKELGYHTVHLRQGRGRCAPQSHPAVDYSIDNLCDIRRIVEEEI